MQLDWPLPDALAVGSGTVLFVGGTCFDPDREIRALQITVGGRPQPVDAFAMPRLDLFRALHPRLDALATQAVTHDPESPDDPGLHSYRSGFWALARVPGASSQACELGLREACELGLRATLAGGGEATHSLARLPLARPIAPLERPLPDGEGPAVAICMASHNPPPELFRTQVESIRAQTHRRWVCVISDDGSRPESVAAMREVLGSDDRFSLVRSPRRRGFYLNFERALALAPVGCDYVAMVDQDDRWYPRKLEVLLGRIGGAPLVYSDLRVVDAAGARLADSFWERRRNNHDDLISLLVANCVTGAASLMRREVLDYALPFPPAQFAHYHDHWIGLVARALGKIAFVGEPLYDYVQHGDAALGHAESVRVTALRRRLGRVLDDPRERVRVNRARYFIDVMRLRAFATVLLMRCGGRMSSAQRRALERFLAAEHSATALAWVGGRAVRELARRRPQTLGAEWEIGQALVWRRALGLSARPRPTRRLRLDALPPPDLAPAVAARPPDVEGPRAIAEKLRPLELSVSAGAPRRVNVLIPTIDLEHFFGGYIAKFNLARRLAERGARVRVVTVDPVGPLPRGWRQTVQSYSGLAGCFDRVEIAFARGSGRLEVNPRDAFVASTWWTAHLAHGALAELGRSGFLYLIQEYEPFTFPMGSWAALAEESYRLDHFALFSTELLRGFFRRREIGVFAAGASEGERRSLAFQNAITPVEPPDEAELARRRTRRLLFYARPEPHASRNLFELGLLALGQAARAGVFAGGWELRGIGSLGGLRRISLSGEAELELLPRRAQGSYGELLREHDVGLALMYTPHPSLVPIEMAAAGLLTVTNTFENKTAQKLAEISGNLIAAEPTVGGIVAGLRVAAEGVGDPGRRVRGGAVRWSRTWEEAFSDALLERLDEFLGAGI